MRQLLYLLLAFQAGLGSPDYPTREAHSRFLEGTQPFTLPLARLCEASPVPECAARGRRAREIGEWRRDVARVYYLVFVVESDLPVSRQLPERYRTRAIETRGVMDASVWIAAKVLGEGDLYCHDEVGPDRSACADRIYLLRIDAAQQRVGPAEAWRRLRRDR